MNKSLTLIYWKEEKFWLGKLLEYPDIMTQGETLEELEENIRDAYQCHTENDDHLSRHIKRHLGIT
ncbi:MAG TPA: type II toxin-antitoxin system HicB family antitoxin [Blastocatellia bacterium]|nr:type II toxin-antitoxin system HicB family antitoxin [Blastocatellia bacterium]